MIKGQSAIEYLTTYGWMLLVIAIVGGAIFSTVQNSSQVQTTSGFANADVRIEEFGVTSNGLETEIRAASSEQVENVNVSLVDDETGETVYASEKPTIPVGDTETVSFSNVGSSENTNTYDVRIEYDTGSLTGLTVEGSITGQISMNGTVPENNNNDGGSTDTNSNPTASFTANTTSVSVDEEFEVDASGSSDSDGSISSYEWDWTQDGTYEDSSNVQTHSYSSADNYTVELRVTDDDGATDTATTEIEVNSETSTATTTSTQPVSNWITSTGSGNTLYDNESVSNGAITGASWSSGTWSDEYSLNFGSSNDYVDVGDDSTYDPGDGPYSIAVTIQSSVSHRGLFVGKASGGGGGFKGGYGLGFGIGGGGGDGSPGQIAFEKRNSQNGNTNAIYTSNYFDDGNKHRVVATDEGNNETDGMKIYVNGSEADTVISSNDGTTGTVSSGGAPLLFGGQSNEGQYYFEGNLDNFVWFDEELNSTEIQEDYEAQPWS